MDQKYLGRHGSFSDPDGLAEKLSENVAIYSNDYTFVAIKMMAVLLWGNYVEYGADKPVESQLTLGSSALSQTVQPSAHLKMMVQSSLGTKRLW